MGAHFTALVAWLLLSTGAAQAQEYLREEIRIPMPAAGRAGLEALFVKPNLPGRLPLVLINHGSPRKPEDRQGMTPLAFVPHAMEFARRGFAVAIVMRRGYGDSGGGYAESSGPCANADYFASANAAVADARAALAHLTKRPDIDATKVLSVGQSAGGFTTVALTGEPPAGLVAAINFAGGRGSLKDDEVCNPNGLVNAFAAFGKRSRVPMLWVYTENDHFFGPALAQRFHEAFSRGGGKVEFIKAPAFGRDGHSLFAEGIPLWLPYVDGFLKKQNLVLRETPLPLPPRPNIAPPKQLSEAGRKAFEDFLTRPPHRAFAMSPKGAYGWQSGRRTVQDASKMALERCLKHGTDCNVVVIDDKPAP
jgi:dienelactone hydrolase